MNQIQISNERSKCMLYKPSFLERMRVWFGQTVETHTWEHYDRLNKAKQIIFRCRKCRCGRVEIQQNGPMGRNDWKPLSDGFKTEWELERFELSEEV